MGGEQSDSSPLMAPAPIAGPSEIDLEAGPDEQIQCRICHETEVLNQDDTPLLYSLVFGEGVVNDATSVVLFNAIQKLDVNRVDGWTAASIFVDFMYLFSTSTALGVASGLLTAYILKGLYFGRHSSVREIALMVLMAYLSYMLAELLELSGILTVFFCGIFMSHYAWHNVTDSSRITIRHIFSMMSFMQKRLYFYTWEWILWISRNGK